MPLKILIADDSMTAQNMGKKILVDAGFEVVPVSNGAAAIKKIAETKPDIIILDIYMPGYTGLEVCEKVKAAPETANVPVLLTVGKLEPYRPEEGAKAKAEGVIIKPFEATDLLTALARIAQKYNLSVPQIEPIEVQAPEQQEPSKDAPYEKTMRLSAEDLQSILAKPSSETAMAAAAAVPAAIAMVSAEATQKIEIPAFAQQEVASAPASPFIDEKPIAIPEAPAPMFAIEESPAEASAPAYNIADLTSPTPEAPAYIPDEIAEHPEVESPSLGAHSHFKASSVPDDTGAFSISGVGLNRVPLDPEPMYSSSNAAPTAANEIALEFSGNTTAYEPASAAPANAEHELETFEPALTSEPTALDPELETTAAAKVEGDVDSLAELETTQQLAETEMQHVVDPALVTSPDELMQFTIKVGTDKEEPAVERDPLSKELVEALYAQPDIPPPVEEAATAEAPEESELPSFSRTYEDDPLVQMGVISIQPEAGASQDLVSEFYKPFVEEEESPAARSMEAVQEMPSAAAEPVSEDEHLAKSAGDFHEAVSTTEPEPHALELKAEPADEVAAAMAAIAAVPIAGATATHHEELAASLSAALDSVASGQVADMDHANTEDTKKFAASAGMDAMHVARAVQRVFERYKEKMVADITDELSKGD